MTHNQIAGIIFWAGAAGMGTSLVYALYAQNQSKKYRTQPDSGISAEKMQKIDKGMKVFPYVMGTSGALMATGYLMSRPVSRY